MSELDEYFRYRCIKGLAERGLSDKPEYVDRLNFEMDTIIRMKFPGYFLVVSDKIVWAKKHDILVGPGRGSAAGSLVTYCLKITDLDPIKYKLLFERFLNPGRVSDVDIDVDYSKAGRYEVIDYVTQKYGADHVAHIGTFGYLKAKSAVKSIARVMDQDYQTGDRLSKLLLNPIHGKYQSIAQSIEKVDELQKFIRAKGLEADLLEKAQLVEGMINNVGVHAAGIVISNDSLFGKVPLFLGRSGEITAQWDMKNVADVGLVKFDFLGLDTLDRIQLAMKLIKKNHGITIDITNIPIDDEKVFENLRSGDTCGIFQLEASSGIRDLLVQIRPTNIEDIIALVALYRPGPLASKEFHHYIQVRMGNAKPNYLVPELKTILGPTDGLMVYQEQILQIAKDFCGYSLAEADLLRRAIGKKKEDEMAAQHKKFISGWIANGYPEEKGNILWADIVGFADYCFNRSHSACYGFITYQTAWLKAHYPVEWMTAIMTQDRSNTDQIIKYISECKRLNIKVLPPDINKSDKYFSIDEDNNIRFGLAPIKNLGDGPVDEIINKRADGRFDDLMDFCNRVDLATVNKLKLQSLIKSGAFDNGKHTRAGMVMTVEKIWEHRDEVKKYESKMVTYQKRLPPYEARLLEIEKQINEKGKTSLRPLKVPEKPEEPIKPTIQELPELDQQEILATEHELLGYYVSAHPLDEYRGTIAKDGLLTIDLVKELPHQSKIEFGAVITRISEITTAKTKQKMAFLSLEDTTGVIEGVVFSSIYSKFKELIGNKCPLKFEGKLEVTESEDEKTVKVSIFNISILEKKNIIRREMHEIAVKAKDATSLTKMNRSKNNNNGVRLTFNFDDGTKVKCLQTVYVDKAIKNI
jgi:DNA polymerase III subunit alpha